jgi:hypothetical protein
MNRASAKNDPSVDAAQTNIHAANQVQDTMVSNRRPV